MKRFGLILVAIAGCQSPGENDSLMPMMRGQAGDEKFLVNKSHEGKRVEIKLKDGSAHRGTIAEVDLAKNRVRMKVELEDEVRETTLYLSNITYVAVLQSKEEPHDGKIRGTLPVTGSRTVGDNQVKTVFIDFRKEHTLEECLLDLAKPATETTAGALFVAADSTLRVRTIPATQNDAAPLAFAWHAHLFYGANGHRVVQQNEDQEVVVGLQGTADPQRLVLVSTPHRVENEARGFRAFAPPRVVNYRLLPQPNEAGVLNNNPAFVRSVATALGKMYVAATPYNEAEMSLIAFDPEGAHSTLLDQVRYSVQRVLLLPLLTAEVSDPKSGLRTRAGIYPRPPFLTADASVTLEVREKALGTFPTPPNLTVHAPARAQVRADLDLHYHGLQEGVPYRLVLAYGYTGEKKGVRVNVHAGEPKPASPRDTVSIDLSSEKGSQLPTYVFVWHQLAAAWNEKGGRLGVAPPLDPVQEGASTKKRHILYPTAAPYLIFLQFIGKDFSKFVPTQPDLATMSPDDDTLAKLALPKGSGPFNVNPSSVIGLIDEDEFKSTFGAVLGTKPVSAWAIAAASGAAFAWARARASAMASASAYANAYVNVVVNCCCGHGKGSCDGEGTPTTGGGRGGGGHGPPGVPTYDPAHFTYDAENGLVPIPR